MAGQARQPLAPGEKRSFRVMIVALIATAIVIAGFFATILLLGRPARTDDLLAMIAGYVLLLMTVLMAVAFTVMPRDPDLPHRRLSHLLAAATSTAALLLLIVGKGWIDPRTNFVIVLVLIAASCWFDWRMWQVSDELDRTITKETYVATCFVLFIAFWVYATAERLGVLGGVTAWGVLAFTALASIPIAIWIGARHGGIQTPDDE